MSAVFDTLKQEAIKREETGFTTTRGQPVGTFSGDDPWVTANRAMVSSTASAVSLLIGYAAPILAGWPLWEKGIPPCGAALVRPDTFFVPMQKDASTMGTDSEMFADIVEGQRGVVALDMPYRTIHSEEVVVYTAKLKRMSPSAIIGGRDHGEENA